MDRKLPVASLLSLTIVALLGGCGGSDSADKTTDPVPPTPTTKNLDVRAVDGYLKGAQVWLDLNGDNLLTDGEPKAVTDGSGKATLDVTAVDNPAKYRVLVKAIVGQTTDVGDGNGTPKTVTKAFTMAAPAGVSTVTPLTTLVAQQMAADSGMTQEQAAQEVATQLGLGADKAGDLLKDFIAEKNSTGQVYALNIVAALPDVLDDKQADDLLTQGTAIGKALDDYLAQNPLDDGTKPDDIKVVIGDDGTVDDVIKDSDGDGKDDSVTPPVTSDTLAAFFLNTSDMYMAGGGDSSDDTLWTDHWTSLGSGNFGWKESNILIGKTQYKVDTSMGDVSYRLGDSGWAEVKDSDDIHMVANSDGSVSLTDPSHAGKLTGSCKDVGGKTLTSVVAASTQVVDSSATFTAGAVGCEVQFTNTASDGSYRIDTWTHSENSVSVNGHTAVTLAELFSSSAPVAEGSNAIASVFDKPIDTWSESHGNVRLVLVRASANDTSGIAQLWQYNANIQGYQLLSDITPANHQGWTLQTLHGVTLLTLSDAIQQYLNQGHDYMRIGFTEWQGRVQWVDNSDGANGETMLFMNKVAYDDLFKGRTLVTDSDDSDGDGDGVADTNDAFPNDASEWSDTDGDGVGDNGDAFPNDPTKWQAVTGFASTYPTMNLRGTINNWGVTPMTLVADHLWSVTVTLTATDTFKFDVAGDWSINFGDANHDGTAELNADNNIATTVTGTYVVTFNDETLEYSLTPQNDAGSEEAAAAFADLINSDEIVYSVYQEHGALGLTRVDGNSYQGYQLDYSQSVGSFVPTDAGTLTLSVDANNQVTMFDAGSGRTSTIICQQVQALAEVKIQDLLAPMTSDESLAAMQQTFGDATFTGDAKAYINQHTDSEGSSPEIVLNETAYQNLVASIRNPS
jgi:hypothetical protein